MLTIVGEIQHYRNDHIIIIANKTSQRWKTEVADLFLSFSVLPRLVIQITFSAVDMTTRSQYVTHVMPLSDIHLAVWVLVCVWPLAIIILNELVKCLEIK